MKIGLRLAILFFALAFVSVTVIGYLSYDRAKASLKNESFNRLTAVREMKAAQIEDYFQEIRNQILTLSESRSTIEAMHSFKKGYQSIDEDIVATTINENNLRKYYEIEFLPKLNANIPIQANVDDYWPENSRTKLLQELYISGNPNPVGNKHLLDSAEDTCLYAKTHSIYHPIFKNFSEKFGYYDIFLIDDKTGDIVYSVFKEVDFATSLKDGPFANTNFSRSF